MLIPLLRQCFTLAAIIMKTLITTAGFLFLTLHLYSQLSLDSSLISERLSNEIRKYDQIEGCYIGCYGNKSVLFKKADSLKKIVGQTFENYFSDSSLILRYYSFLTVLKANDAVAFEKLKLVISDTRKMDYEFAGQNRGTADFNSLLAFEYLQFIKFKYYYGGILAKDGQTYNFPKRNMHEWKAKKSKFCKLIAQNKVDTRLIGDYCR